MEWIFFEYPRCSTVRKAKMWLDERSIKYTPRHIVNENPTAAEIKELHTISGLDIKKIINTSGKKYRELGLKDKIKELSLDEVYEILATDGMLLKRPILYNGKQILVGFKEEQWAKVLSRVDADATITTD